MLDATAHYVKPAGRTYTPAAVIFLDTETRDDLRELLEVHTLRLWEAQIVRRRDRRRPGEHLTETGESAVALASKIDSWASYGEATWLYAHNVTFDLTVTRLASHLGELGWVLSSRFAVGGDSMWAVFHKGPAETEVTEVRHGRKVTRRRIKWRHTLTIADSASLFPGPLAQLGPHVGVLKPDLPGGGDTDETWAARCHADVEILRLAVLTLMDWWDANDLGHWTVTGAGQAWQTYKRTLTPRQLVIDHDPGILQIERDAVYGGRRDVFTVGQLPPGRYCEVDFEAAYPTVAASYPLPARAACPVMDKHRAAALRGHVPAGMLAEVTINTTVPRWPVRVGGRVFYPVGRFKTVLAAPDIQAAADAHALEAVHDGWLFTLTNHLRDWARQVLAWVRDASGSIPGVVRIWAKLASRAVIGKFAQRGWSTVPFVGPPCDGWSVEQTSDLYSGLRGVITGVNGDYWLSWADQRGEHERPAVLAFVEAHVRARLGRIVTGRFGPAIPQCDTDGFMVSHTRLEQLAADLPARYVHGRQQQAGTPEVIALWNDQNWPLVLREKTQFTRATVYGPQHVILDGRPRFAGVPKGAWQTSDQIWMARLWPGMTWQSQQGVADGYARPLQPYRVAGPYAAGWALENGTVTPAETTLDDSGGTYLLHFKQTAAAASGAVLGPVQAPWAEGLWERPADDQD
ncbi:MAG TPA: hypothetical protein VGR84_05425 [Candidatus Acidoferrales bacterium]|nr:hypothetical protein [Candidatus Acidoferrales bacterium]